MCAHQTPFPAERLRDNTLLIKAALVEGLGSQNPDMDKAIANIILRVSW